MIVIKFWTGQVQKENGGIDTIARYHFEHFFHEAYTLYSNLKVIN
jgi:hypothetical protein